MSNTDTDTPLAYAIINNSHNKLLAVMEKRKSMVSFFIFHFQFFILNGKSKNEK